MMAVPPAVAALVARAAALPVTVARPLLLVGLVLAVPGLYVMLRRGVHRRNLVVGGLRTLVLVLLVLAASGVALETTVQRAAQPEATVLRDASRSMAVVDEPALSFEGVDVREEVIAAGNSSDLRDGLLRALEPGGTYLVVSDMQSSTGLREVVERYRAANATLHWVKPGTEREAAVHVDGPRATVPGVRNRFTVTVSSTGSVPRPRVTVDGRRVALQRIGNRTWQFARTFTGTGAHVVEARVDVSDRFHANDRYRHVTRVMEKPEVLVVGESGSLEVELGEFYDVTRRRSVPDDLSPYYAVVLKRPVDASLVDYVARGNGVVFTGSVQDGTMDVLPVRPSSEEQEAGARLVLAVDISTSTGEAGVVKAEKRIAYNLVDMLPYTNEVGVVAYNDEVYQLAPPKPLLTHRETLKQRIARLQPSGPSFHDKAIVGAASLLNGTGNIVLITDGKIGGLGSTRGVPERSRDAARDLSVQLTTVAVGEDANTALLRELAELGGGQFFDGQHADRLRFRFAGGGAAGAAERMAVMDPRHFITRGLSLSAAVSFFDEAAPRRAADVLVRSSSGRPVLTTWRYGLGAAAAFSAGGPELERLLDRQPVLVTRTVSWAVGDPRRKEDRWVRVEPGRRPAPVTVTASYPAEGLKREAEERYTGEVRPTALGVHRVLDVPYAYNYNRELQAVGHADVGRLVRRTGGRVFTPEESAAIREAVVQRSRERVPGDRPLSRELLAAALLLFLLEVGYRKRTGTR